MNAGANAMAVPTTWPQSLPPIALASYGLLGMPLAMAALPLYVHLPKYYGDHLGMPLGLLGTLLLALRLVDGILDPLFGAWSDRGASRKRLIGMAMLVLALGMIALFMPPQGGVSLALWLGLTLAIVYSAFSLATINHNAWGAELSADPVERTRITGVREALALTGVVIASVVPVLLGGEGGEAAGLPRFAIVFAAICLACTLLTLRFAPITPRSAAVRLRLRASIARALADPLFRRLLLAFMVNGIASAIPATLVLFFISDVLGAEGTQGYFLALYFVSAVAGMPLWIVLSARIGKVGAWLLAMVLAVAAFAWAARLGNGDTTAFAVICAVSGLALGADLALPPSLLADVIGRNGRMDSVGTNFGIWTLATKLNLALAAGIALPLLAWLGYSPGTADPGALTALALVYAALPCALKLGAIVALAWFNSRWRYSPT